MKKIISILLMILGVVLFIILYLETIYLSKETYFSVLLFITGYVAVIVFAGGFILYMSFINNRIARKDKEKDKKNTLN